MTRPTFTALDLRMRKFILSMALSLLVLCAGELDAQVCLGLPSFSTTNVHLNGVAEFPDSARVYAGAIAAGTDGGLFANLGGGQVSYTGLSEKTTFGILELGLQIPVGPLQICPIVGGYLGTGPDDPEAALTVTSDAFSGGFAAAVPLGRPALRVIPNVGFRYQYSSQTVEQEEIGTATDTFRDGWVDLGVGLVIADRFGVQPLVRVPVIGDGVDTTFGIFLSAGVGRF